MRCFELIRTDTAKIAMPSGGIVERNVFRDVDGCQIPVLIDQFFDAFLFQAGEERLDRSVVPTVMNCDVRYCMSRAEKSLPVQ